MARSVITNMLRDKEFLPEGMKSLFEELFLQGMAEEDVALKRGISSKDLLDEKAILMRRLMAAPEPSPSVSSITSGSH